jgi:hypothetical protein
MSYVDNLACRHKNIHISMANTFFSFGRQLPEYSVPVLNERAVRAGAGILFLLAMVAFMNAWLLGNFAPTRVVVVAFLIDFSLRLFVNPSLAPSLVLGQWVVRRQQPEWTGAPQKRFAWAIGFALALLMLYLVVIQGVIGPINLLVCGACLLLLFFESAFGICVGCWVYNRLKPDQAKLCPGGVCEYTPDPAEQVRPGQWLVLILFVALIVLVGPKLAAQGPHVPLEPTAPTAPAAASPASDAAEQARCKVPEFAKAMGHEEKWKLHNNCQ